MQGRPGATHNRPPCVSPAPADRSSPHLVPFYGQCTHRQRRLAPPPRAQNTCRQRVFFSFSFFFARSSEGAGGGLRKKKRGPFFVWLLTLECKQEILREGVLVSGQGSREVIRDLVWRNRTEETHTDWTVSSCRHTPTPTTLTSRSSWVASEFHSDYVTRPSWTVFSKLFVYILKVLHNHQPFKWMESSEENHYSMICKQ